MTERNPTPASTAADVQAGPRAHGESPRTPTAKAAKRIGSALRGILTATLLAPALLALTNTPAQAGEPQLTSLVKPFTFIEPPTSFGSEGSGPGQFSGGGENERGPTSLAVEDATGDVFALDPGNNRLEKFGPNGEFLSEIDGLSILESQVAVDNSATSPSKGDVYVVSRNYGFEKFAPVEGEPNRYESVSQLPIDGSAVAVNAKGDVYVYAEGGRLLEFSPTGEALGEVGIDISYYSFGATIAPDGDLYISGFIASEGFETGVLKVAFSPSPELEVESESVFAEGGHPGPVAVDAKGNVYQGEYNQVTEYNSSGEVIEAFGREATGETTGIAFREESSPAVSGYLYVAFGARHEVHIFEQRAPEHPAPEVTGCSLTNPTPVNGVIRCTVDPNAAEASVDVEYGELGSATLTTTSAQDVKAGGQVEVELKGFLPQTRYRYRMVATSKEGATKGEEEVFKTPLAVAGVGGCSVPNADLENEGATLHGGTLEPLGVSTSWRFEYGEAPNYGSDTAEESSESSGKVTPEPKLAHLKPHTTYHCRLVARNEYGTTTGADGVFTTTGPPVLEGEESFEKVGSVDAELAGRFDPVGFVGKLVASTYYFEYGTSTAYGLRTPETSVAEEKGSVAARTRLTGLQPGTEYHARLVATDQYGTTDGADIAFTTFTTIGSGLPDDRIYELVSPPEDNNADVYIPLTLPRDLKGAEEGSGITGTEYPFRASLEGNAITYVGDPSYEGSGNTGEDGGNEYLATRTTDGWRTQNITPLGHFSAEYQAFSPDLSVGFLTSGDGVDTEPLAPEAPGGGYNVIYARTSSSGSYRPLYTLTALVRSKDRVGWYEEGTGGPRHILYAGASADSSDVLFETAGALTPEAAEGTEREDNLYDFIDGRLTSVNVLPSGAPAPGATFGAYPPQPEEEDAALKYPNLSRVISANGSRTFWTDLHREVTAEDPAGETRLFVRENAGSPEATTVQIDASQAPAGEGAKEKQEREARSGGGEFWTASSDGSKVFFTDCNRLTEDSTAVFSSECLEHPTFLGNFSTGNDLYEYEVATGRLTDLTVDHDASDPLGADVQGVIGASEDGEYVYFVADGDLAEGASAGEPNLYLRHGGQTTFIATLSEEDKGSGGSGSIAYGDWLPVPGRRTAEVTPDGHAVVFQSVNSLTGHPSNGASEVYVYDAETAQLSCASCLPTGEVPSGESFLPPGGDQDSTYQPRWISANGDRVFFDSTTALAPHDTNGRTDVYEWERDGSGSCQESRGCVYLLSGGTSPYGSFFIDASANGDDAFFVTRLQLSQQDGNENYNLYDAHVGGVLPPSEPECSGTGCQGVPLAPTAFESPSSVTFDGVGNFPPSAGSPAHKPPAKKKAVKRKRKRGRRRPRKAGRVRHASGARRSPKSAPAGRGRVGRS